MSSSAAEMTAEDPLTETESRRLRRALGAFPTGVVIATAMDAEAGPLGMTMNSFASVSLDPPLVSFSIDRRAASLPCWMRAPGYALNVLASGQEPLSNQFARSLTDKWKGVSFARGLHDAPLLANTLACFECSRHSAVEGGDHVIFLARIERFVCDEAAEPLVFHRGRYRAVSSRTIGCELNLPPVWPLSIHY